MNDLPATAPESETAQAPATEVAAPNTLAADAPPRLHLQGVTALGDNGLPAVHELSLAVRPGEFGSLRGRFRVRVRLAQREMPKDKSQPRPKVLLDQLDDRMCQSAIRAFVVAILDQRHRRVVRTLHMIFLVHRN